MPDSPYDSENKTCSEQVEAPPDAVDAVRVPAELFNNRGDYQKKPRGKNSRSE